MDPEERRAARLAAVRAQRGTTEREQQIADLEAHRRIEPTPRDRSVRVRRTTSAPKPKRTGQTTASGFFGHPWAEWHQMVDAGRDHLVDRASSRTTTTADELWQHIGTTLGLSLGDPRLPMPFLLRDITKRGREDTDLVLAALVVDHEAFADQDPRPPSRERHVEALFAEYGEG